MIKKRICFVLLYFENNFCVSRNFNLQKVGNIEWLLENYDFEKILKAIDELIILNINKNSVSNVYNDIFFDSIKKILKKSFLPVSIGGGIYNFESVVKLFEKGADKIIINTAFYKETDLIKNIVDVYGSQSLIASIDYKGSGLENSEVFINNGSTKIDLRINDCVDKFEKLGAGELFINSIDRDGLGYGYDFKTLEEIYLISKIPIICGGGADNYIELLNGVNSKFTNGVSTSHLFNFIGDGLSRARVQMINNKADIPIR
jgi:cyclase